MATIPTEDTNQSTQQPVRKFANQTAFAVIFVVSFSHLLNDTIQSLIPAVYPLLKDNFDLSFSQIGLITLTFQMCASMFQPLVGHVTDRHPQPFSLSMGMGSTLMGIILLSFAPHFAWILVAVGLVGIGSSVFHPEASRVLFLAASQQNRGLAQSIFQVGGQAGAALGPLLAAVVVVRLGQSHIWWFGILTIIAMALLFRVGQWYRARIHLIKRKTAKAVKEMQVAISHRKVVLSIVILMVLIFSKYFYLASMTSYLTFYLIDKFEVSVAASQLYLFAFLLSCAVGNLFGGPLGDRFGRKYVIWFSILGSAPFTLILPHVNLIWTLVMIICVGLIISSAFPAILVYAQELLPGKVGMISGLFYGLAFGMGGIGAAVLGILADKTDIYFVYAVCAYLPLLGLVAGFLPKVHRSS